MATNTSKIGFHDLDNEVNEKMGSIDTLESRPVNNNILINSNFANPVNQRGVTAESWTLNGGYGLDRWQTYSTTPLSIVAINNSGLVVQYLEGYDYDLAQNIEFLETEKDYAFSICIDGEVKSGSCRCSNETYDNYFSELYNDDSFMAYIFIVEGANHFRLNIRFKDHKQHIIEWVKLEKGSVATPYVPRLYAEELELCQRYYREIYLHVKTYVYTTTMQYMRSMLPKMRVSPTVTARNGKFIFKSETISGINIEVSSASNGQMLVKASGGNISTYANDNSFIYCFIESIFVLDAEL